MRFDLYVHNKFKLPLYITQFNPLDEQHNLYSTFDEKISHSDNDQITLTFSLAGKIPNEVGALVTNPFLKYLTFGSKVYLDTDIGLYELVITQIAPKLGTKNAIYNYTCQDWVSYKWTRMSLGYSYDTMERGGVKTLFEIARDILSDCKLNREWTIKENNTHLYPNKDLKTNKITLQIEGSNPYNALVEGMNALNASMLVNYKYHEIRFYQKDKVLFSGYRYRPETNLRSLSATYNIDELATIMHVIGGTDEHEMNVMLVPPMPDAIYKYFADGNEMPSSYSDFLWNNYALLDEYFLTKEYTNAIEREAYDKERQNITDFCLIADKVPSLGQFLYNFDFFKQNGLMSQDVYNNITNIFNVQMRDINIKLKPLLQTYYIDTWEMNKHLIDAKTEIEQINALYSAKMDGDNTTTEEELTTLVDTHKTNIARILGTGFKNIYYSIYGRKTLLQNNEYIPEIQNILDDINLYVHMRDESKYYYDLYQNEHETKYNEKFTGVSVDNTTNDGGTYDYDRAQLQGDILYYKNRFYYALQMCGNVVSADDFVSSYQLKDKAILRKYQPIKNDDLENNPTEDSVDCYFAILWDYFVNTIEIQEDEEYGINGMVTSLQNEIQQLWNILYSDYSQFIYEATYENSDELNSVSLYNQAITYFENYHHPKSNYSVEIVNFNDLEQIGIPNLKVNSKIRVYNEDLGLDEGLTYDGGELTKLNNISYTNNELLITGLNYDLRKSAIASITVEHIVQHQNILQKLIKNIK